MLVRGIKHGAFSHYGFACNSRSSRWRASSSARNSRDRVSQMVAAACISPDMESSQVAPAKLFVARFFFDAN